MEKPRMMICGRRQGFLSIYGGTKEQVLGVCLLVHPSVMESGVGYLCVVTRAAIPHIAHATHLQSLTLLSSTSKTFYVFQFIILWPPLTQRMIRFRLFPTKLQYPPGRQNSNDFAIDVAL
jgi:hypothetical protein